VASLKLIDKLEQGVLENCRRMGDRLRDGLLAVQKDHPEIGQVRQAGLHIGIELVKDPVTREPAADLLRRTREAGFENGIIFGVGGAHKNVLKIKPPLIISGEEADEVLDRFEKSLEKGLEKTP
jgi:4-aminobutyrate aminotransferase-like enzyme